MYVSEELLVGFTHSCPNDRPTIAAKANRIPIMAIPPELVDDEIVVDR